MSGVESTRRRYLPRKVTTLFVGESAPVSGKFFYRGNTQFFTYVRKALGGDKNFLGEFKAKGFFLDDLVHSPVNHLPSAQRRKKLLDAKRYLAKRIARYRPQVVVSVMKSIHDVVADAIAQSGAPNIRHYRVPFPGNGRQNEFLREMKKIRRKLASVNQQ